MHSIWLEDNVIPGKQHEDDAYGPVIARELPDGSRLLLARNIRHLEELQDITLFLMAVILIVAALPALAMGNLLDNAIKYTPKDGATQLQVKPSRDGVEVIVADSGPGIPNAEKKAHVLERFVRLDNSRQTPGNGLGLSLVKAVAGVHGAELVLGDNRPGLIATLRLPHDRLKKQDAGDGVSFH